MTARKFYMLAVGVLVLSLFSIIGAYYVGNQKLQAKSQEMASALTTRDITQEKIVRLEKAREDAKELENVVELLDRLMPKAKEQDKLIADIIYTATAEAEIPFSKVRSFSFSGTEEPNSLSGTIPSKTNPGVLEYPFSLQIEEITYDTLLKLLTEIETNGRIVQVDNVQISPDNSNPNILDVTLSTKAYVRP